MGANGRMGGGNRTNRIEIGIWTLPHHPFIYTHTCSYTHRTTLAFPTTFSLRLLAIQLTLPPTHGNLTVCRVWWRCRSYCLSLRNDVAHCCLQRHLHLYLLLYSSFFFRVTPALPACAVRAFCHWWALVRVTCVCNANRTVRPFWTVCWVWTFRWKRALVWMDHYLS